MECCDDQLWCNKRAFSGQNSVIAAERELKMM